MLKALGLGTYVALASGPMALASGPMALASGPMALASALASKVQALALALAYITGKLFDNVNIFKKYA